MGLAQDLSNNFGSGLTPLEEDEYNKVRDRIISVIKDINHLGVETLGIDLWNSRFEVNYRVRDRVNKRLKDFLIGEGFRVVQDRNFDNSFRVYWGSRLIKEETLWQKLRKKLSFLR